MSAPHDPNTTQSDPLPVTDRTKAKRRGQRVAYDRETLYGILDASPMCHVGMVVDGAPVVTPTFHWRIGDRLYWHGGIGSRPIRKTPETQVCVTVSLLDGLVLARSGMHHSANYRSVMLFGSPEPVTDPAEKEAALKAFLDHLIPERWPHLRPISVAEIKATGVLSLPIEEASAKIRVGDPMDDEEDYALPIWAGVVPLRLVADTPIPDPRNQAGLQVPAHVMALMKQWK